MKAHNGMRPQDIVLLLKILTVPAPDWQYRALAASLYLSISEVSESLNRSHIAQFQVHLSGVSEFRRKPG
jgi:hypothetical protein